MSLIDPWPGAGHPAPTPRGTATGGSHINRAGLLALINVLNALADVSKAARSQAPPQGNNPMPRTRVPTSSPGPRFPGGPVVRTRCFHCSGPGSILVGELRSCKPSSLVRKQNKSENRDFSGSLVATLHAPNAGDWVPSLVTKTKSCVPQPRPRGSQINKLKYPQTPKLSSLGLGLSSLDTHSTPAPSPGPKVS